jgi:hypothetical protein
MGGTNETTIAGLRIHRNNGEVHIHDDSKSKKFCMGEKYFSNEVSEALKGLKQKDSVVSIGGRGADLILGKSGQGYFMALVGNTTVSEINDLIKGL